MCSKTSKAYKQEEGENVKSHHHHHHHYYYLYLVLVHNLACTIFQSGKAAPA